MKKKTEFTKIIMSSVIGTYFFGTIIGSIAVLKDTSQLPAFFTFIGAPTATAIGFYCWKAKCENLIRLKKTGVVSSDDFNLKTPLA
jgi:hypothetical protein